MLISYKGNANSGNHGHGGRKGKIGGSTPSGFAYPMRDRSKVKEIDPSKIIIDGKSGQHWMDESKAISEQRTAYLRSELSKVEGLDAASTEKYISRLNTHRALVMEETLRESQYWQLSKEDQRDLISNVLHHDSFDKFETDAAVPYINKIALGGQKGGAGETPAFWKACNAHHDENPHHPEHWTPIDSDRAVQMPSPNVIEMIGDWKATARFYNTPMDGYYRRFGGTEFVLHPNTRAAAEKCLGIDKTPFPSLFPKEHEHISSPKAEPAATPKATEPAKHTTMAVPVKAGKVDTSVHKKKISLVEQLSLFGKKEYKAGKLPMFGIDAVLLDTFKQGQKQIIIAMIILTST